MNTAKTKAISIQASCLDLRVTALGLDFDMQGWLGLHMCLENLY